MIINSKKLSMRFSVLMGLVIIVAVGAYLIWNASTQQELTEDKVLTEARTINLEMVAMWDYVDDSQGAINYNSDGSYDFKGIYCSIAGKNIAQRFTRQAEGYEIGYARENPRSSTDIPDEFEEEAIELFELSAAQELYRIEDYKGRKVFRYASAIEMKNNCLSCHGDPAGEKDETGFFKEGMRIGDLAGITSIVIPLNIYQREAEVRSVQAAIFFTLLAIIVILVMRFGLKRWVTDPLDKANADLYDESQAKSDFLTVMSHELRTPLSSIIAFTDVWEKDSTKRSEEERKMVGEIKENSRTLLNLVNNTIDVAKIEAGSFGFSYEEVDPVDVVQSVTAIVGPLAFKNNITIEKNITDTTPIIVSDLEAFRKILMNIIGNAVKFSPSGSKIIVSTRGVEGYLEIGVQDFGEGIPEDKQKQVFERFSCVDDGREASSSNGSGLGLFLAKTLTEKMGGSLELVSEEGRGSTFIVRLPIKASGDTDDFNDGVGL